tara:strand:+ start:428 stop:658 length:231 start_codon:yes stop_codon:yes gene_type:complete
MSLKPKKRSLTLHGHQTSVSLEDRFWQAFCDIAEEKKIAINSLAAKIDGDRDLKSGLASALRNYVLDYYIDKCKHF